MSKGNSTENDVLKAILKGTDPAWRDPGANPNLYVSLHNADPGEGGTQATNETGGAVYAAYTRQPVAKTTGWTDGGSTFTNAALIQFPQCVGTGDLIKFVAIGTLASGAGQILYSGQLSADLTVANLIQPQFAIGSLQISED